MCWEDTPVAFNAIVKLIGVKSKNIYRGHRLVVLPDFQGIGFGYHLMNFVAQELKKQNQRFVWTSSNPALIHVCKNDPQWRLTSHTRKASPRGSFSKYGSANRITTSWEYVGDS
jgi:GNAT superfamily N-acetyltransferase